MPFLNQRKGENDHRKYFMISLRERMLPTSAGVEPVTSWSPVGRHIWATEADAFALHWNILVANDSVCVLRRLWSDCASAQSDQGLRCPHMHEDTLSHGTVQMFYPNYSDRQSSASSAYQIRDAEECGSDVGLDCSPLLQSLYVHQVSKSDSFQLEDKNDMSWLVVLLRENMINMKIKSMEIRFH